MGKIIRNGIEFSSTVDTANNISYDNSLSGLEATTTQKAIDELNKRLAVCSTEEKEVGIDYDGRKIYEKTYVGTVTTKNIYSSLHQFYKQLEENIYRIVSCYGDVSPNTGYWYSLNATNYDSLLGLSSSCHIRITPNNKMQIICETSNANVTEYEHRVTIRYTKID